MKTLFTLATMLVSGITLMAQPIITSSFSPVVGDSVHAQGADTTGVRPGNGGATQTWNFSTLSASGAPAVATYVSPSSTPYASLYPTATVVQQSTSTGGQSGYSYYKTATSDFSFLGVSTSQYDFVYSDPMISFKYPFTYNSTFTDDFKGHMVVNGTDVNRVGSFSMTADGYGTLITPRGTYTNVLRVEGLQLIFDTFMVSGFPAGTQVTTATTHIWLSPTIREPLLTINNIKVDNGSSAQYANSVAYYTGAGGTTGMNNLQGAADKISIYPNPAANNCVVNYHAEKVCKVNIEVLDITGRNLGISVTTLLEQGDNEIELNTTEVARGIYCLRVNSESGTFTRKLQIVK